MKLGQCINLATKLFQLALNYSFDNQISDYNTVGLLVVHLNAPFNPLYKTEDSIHKQSMNSQEPKQMNCSPRYFCDELISQTRAKKLVLQSD